MAVTCQYCDRVARLVKGAIKFPKTPTVADHSFWECEPCRAWVSCKKGTDIPLGNLADGKLREARRRGHRIFDPIWQLMQEKKGGSRSAVRNTMYGWLATQLGVPAAECHFGLLPYELTLKAIVICEALQRELQKKYGTAELLTDPAPLLVDEVYLDQDMPI